MKIFSLFVQEPSEIVLSFVLITCIFHFNTVGIDVIEILPKNWIFFNKFVSKQNSPNLNCLQSRRVFSDSSLTFLIIIFKSSLSELNIQIMMIVATMIIISFIIFLQPKIRYILSCVLSNAYEKKKFRQAYHGCLNPHTINDQSSKMRIWFFQKYQNYERDKTCL